MRRAACILHIHRKTVDRKLRFLGMQARLVHRAFLARFSENRVRRVQFDDVETFEHSKMKPLSITLGVTKRRKILGIEVAQMPSKGPLAERARQKYGTRADHRPRALKKFFEELSEVVSPTAVFESDQNPAYPLPLKTHFPQARHITMRSRRASDTGQGELRKGWDPLFSLNHTAAMLRANINRLIRKTWCTTKKAERLRDHLYLYACYHNETLTA
jgi:hypothetical protein